MSEIKADFKLDVRGEVCPFPLLKTTKQIATIDSQKILEVIATDPMAPDNISAWAKDHGHRVLRVDKANGEFHIFVQKK